MRLNSLAFAIALALPLLPSASAVAEPPLVSLERPTRIKSGGTLVTGAGTEVRLPPGVFAPQAWWDSWDLEVRRLQESETRLKAENDSLAEHVNGTVGFGTVLLAASLGVALGITVAVVAF